MSKPPHRGACLSLAKRAAQLLGVVVGLAGTASYSMAQTADPANPRGIEPAGEAAEDRRWSLGIGVINKQDPYRGMDRETTGLPLIRFENDYVKVAGLGFTVKLPGLDLGSSGRIKFGLVGKAELSGYEADDSPFLDGMSERKGGFWAGASAEWETDWAEVSALWVADTSGHSKGQRFSLGVERSWRLGEKVILTPHLTAHWLDKKYVDYYYGVRADEVLAGRAAYDGKSTTNVEVGLRTIYMIDRRHSLLLDVSATGLGAGIEDSPLVDRSSANRVILGYSYSF